MKNEKKQFFSEIYNIAYYAFYTVSRFYTPKKGEIVFSNLLPEIALGVTKRSGVTLTVTDGKASHQLSVGEYVPLEAMRHAMMCQILTENDVVIYNSNPDKH